MKRLATALSTVGLLLAAGGTRLVAQEDRPPVEPIGGAYVHFNGVRLNEPLAVFYDANADELLVADTGNTLLAIFKPDGMPEFTFGAETGLGPSVGVLVDALGRIYSITHGPTRVQVFSYRGEFLRDFPFTDEDGPTEVQPTSMAAGPEGQLVIADNLRKRILVYDADWTFVRSFGHSGGGRGGFLAPGGVAVGPDGRIYVSDQRGTPVQAFSPRGRYEAGWGEHALGAQNFSLPTGIAVHPDGRVFVTDTLRHDIKVFSPKGEFLFHFGGFGKGPGQVAFPMDVGIAPDGAIYVVEKIGRRVQIFRETRAASAKP